MAARLLSSRHPLASVGTMVLGLRCSWCPGSAPMPKLLGLTRCRWLGAKRRSIKTFGVG
jgi:hypothetical protein